MASATPGTTRAPHAAYGRDAPGSTYACSCGTAISRRWRAGPRAGRRSAWCPSRAPTGRCTGPVSGSTSRAATSTASASARRPPVAYRTSQATARATPTISGTSIGFGGPFIGSCTPTPRRCPVTVSRRAVYGPVTPGCCTGYPARSPPGPVAKAPGRLSARRWCFRVGSFSIYAGERTRRTRTI